MGVNECLAIGVVVLFLFLMFRRRVSEQFDSVPVKISDGLYRMPRDTVFNMFSQLGEKESYMINAIGNDGDTVKVVGTAPALIMKNRERPPQLMYGGSSGDFMFKNIELGKEYKCLPETFGGIDPAPNVRKSCFIMPM